MDAIFYWWKGSPLQVGILVSLFWVALIVAICALAGANRRGRDMGHRDVDAIREASRPAPLNTAAADSDRPRVRGISS